MNSEVAPWMSPAKAGLPKSRLPAYPRFSPWAKRCRPPRRAEMPRQPIKGLAMGSWCEREDLRIARTSGRNQLAHGDNHGIRSLRAVSLSPPWRATSRGGLISWCAGLFQHVLGQPLSAQRVGTEQGLSIWSSGSTIFEATSSVSLGMGSLGALVSWWFIFFLLPPSHKGTKKALCLSALVVHSIA